MLRAKLEAIFIRIAVKILMNRNLARAPVTSRQDNNTMWYMAEQLEHIAKRIQNGYKEQEGA